MSLRNASPQPRAPRPSPAYPRLLALGFAAALTACGGTVEGQSANTTAETSANTPSERSDGGKTVGNPTPQPPDPASGGGMPAPHEDGGAVATPPPPPAPAPSPSGDVAAPYEDAGTTAPTRPDATKPDAAAPDPNAAGGKPASFVDGGAP